MGHTPNQQCGNEKHAHISAGVGAGGSSLSPRNRRILLAILIIGTFMANLDAVMVNVALPTITRSFHTDLALSQWTITGYILAMAGLLIIFGKISEYTGISRLYRTGFVLFTASSLACGLSATIWQLILFRVLQGTGASMIYCGMGPLILHASGPNERGKAMGYVTAAVAGATLLGPALGGIVTDLVGWQYIFLLNIPAGIIVLAAAHRHMRIPEKRKDRLLAEMDWTGAITLVAAIVSVLLFLDSLAAGLTDPAVVIAYAAACPIFVALFIAHETRHADPLVDPALFHTVSFTKATISSALFFAALNLTNVVGPFYLEGVMGMNPSLVGELFMIVPLLMFLVSPLIGGLYDRTRHDYATAGLVICAGACILQCAASLTISVWAVLLAFAMRGIGSGFFQGPNNTRILTSLPPDRTAISSSIGSTGRALGIGIGVSLASIAMTLDLGLAGYQGPILAAGPGLLAHASGTALLLGAGICFAAIAMAVLWQDRSEEGSRPSREREEHRM